MSSGPSSVVLIAAMCVGLFFSVLGFAAFPALMPVFFEEWGLDNTEAGWVNGLYFLGYLVAVPALVGVTDRIDTRRVFVVSLFVSTGAAFGFAAAAQGFWTASAFRALAGVGLAGTFLPGMRILVERLEGRTQNRAVAYYAAAFGIGASVSYLLAGEIEDGSVIALAGNSTSSNDPLILLGSEGSISPMNLTLIMPPKLFGTPVSNFCTTPIISIPFPSGPVGAQFPNPVPCG